MKRALTLMALLGMSTLSMASSGTPEKKEFKMDECTRTASAVATVSTKCSDGSSVSVNFTESCTIKSSNCALAQSDALVCATIAA